MSEFKQGDLSLSNKRLILTDYVDNRTEEDFMKEVLMPLFENMKYEVIYNHGPGELGKDFVLKKKNDLNEDEVFCVVVKNGDISGSSRGVANLGEVGRQVEQSLKTDLSEFGFVGKLPHKVLVFTPGKISSHARRQLAQDRDILSSTKVSFFYDEKLITLIDKYYPIFFQVSLPSTARYLSDLVDHIENITTIDQNFSSLLNLENLKCMKESKSGLESQGPRQTKAPDEVPQKGLFSWIQGGTGSGKTFTVYRIAQKALSKIKSEGLRKQKKLQDDIQIPIYIKASNLNFNTENFNFDKFLFEAIKRYSSTVSLDEVRGWLNDFHVVLIFDEYEFKTPKSQLNLVLKESSKFPNLSILVLSRILSESQLRFERSPEVWQMKELNLSNAKRLLHSCIPSENKKGIQLYNDMLNNGVLERVPKTPLALNVLSHVFSGNGNSTPVNMYEFFDMFFELVLGRWEPRRELENALDYIQVRGFLQEVAYEMVLNKQLSVPVAQLVPRAQKILNSTSNTSASPDDFIKAVAKYGEVAVIRDNEFFFTQRTFMEFLAGCEYEKYHWKPEFIIQNITDINWEDALLFAAGSKKKDDEILKKVGEIKETNTSDLFFKMKNIAGLVLALYRSDDTLRLHALQEGVKTAVKLRDNEDFDKSIKRAFKDDQDLLVSLISLSLFSTFYGKFGLKNLLRDALRTSEIDREKFYILSAILETLNDSSDLKALLSHIPTDASSAEGVAFGPYILHESRDSENAEPIKSLLKEKEIKKVTDKAIGILREQKRESKKYIPN